MADIKDWSSLGPLDEEWNETAKAAGGSPDLGVFPSIAAMRGFLEDVKRAKALAEGAFPDVKEQDRKVKMRDGHEIVVRTYHPQNASVPGPLGVLYHGGGWCIGDLTGEEVLCKLMASKLGMTVVNVDYRLGPEWKFPTAHNDCWDATKWVSGSGKKRAALSVNTDSGDLGCRKCYYIGSRPFQRLHNRRHIRWRQHYSHDVPSRPRREALAARHRLPPHDSSRM